MMSEHWAVVHIGKKMKNCWFYLGDQSIWAVCEDCRQQKQPHWVKVPLNLDQLGKELGKGSYFLQCPKGHLIEIERVWFDRKGPKLKPPCKR